MSDVPEFPTTLPALTPQDEPTGPDLADSPDASDCDRASLVELRKVLPDAPGVYRYFDANGRIIYVGKARSLKKRVNSYFTKHQGLDFKTRTMVRQIANIQYTVTRDDMEALLLENNLIKQYQPKYNLMLKDGKTYPYICVKHERFPRVFSTRNRVNDGSTYFGPYPSVGTMNAILHFIRDNYQLRTCNLYLSDKNIRDGKFRPCLEYHMGKCAAPCIGAQREEDYNDDIRQIRHLLKGHYREVLDTLNDQMNAAATSLQFERAHFLKRRIEHIQKHKRRSTVVPETVKDCEVITVLQAEGIAAVNHFRISAGTVIATHSYVTRPKAEESDREILEAALAQLIAEDSEGYERILTNVPMDAPSESGFADTYVFRVPIKGDEYKLIQLSLQNCEALIEEKANISRLRSGESPTMRVLTQLQKDLRLSTLPKHIECFDNSNIQGYAPVSSCVVFKEGRPAKRDYRVYNVKTVVGIDDFASMKEVVFRRYRRMLDENTPLPDLIVIDGGKGQLSHAVEAMQELGIYGKVAIVSIAKRLEEIFVPGDSIPLYIDKKSSALRLLQRLRNEAHNTAITYHRKRRSEKTLRTELKDIKGVGPVTARKLLTALKSVKAVREADLHRLTELVGEAKASIVYDYYQNEADQATPNSTSEATPEAVAGAVESALHLDLGALDQTEVDQTALDPTEPDKPQIPADEKRVFRKPRLPRLKLDSQKRFTYPKHKPGEG